MSLNDDPHTPLRCIGQYTSHGNLCARVQVQLRLFDVNHLTGFCHRQRHQDRQDLRNAEAYIRDVDTVFP